MYVMPKKIDPALRERAVRLVREHRSEYPSLTAASAAVARQVGVGHESVRRWVLQADIDDGTRDGVTSAEHAETKRLKLVNTVRAALMRLASSAALALTIAVSATACDPQPQLLGPVAIREGITWLEIAVCEDIGVSELTVEVRPAPSELEGQVWRASGNTSLRRGQVLTSMGLDSAFPEVDRVASPPLQGIDSVTVILINSDESANNIVAAFDIAGGANLSHSEWLMPGGSKSLEPCP